MQVKSRNPETVQKGILQIKQPYQVLGALWGRFQSLLYGDFRVVLIERSARGFRTVKFLSITFLPALTQAEQFNGFFYSLTTLYSFTGF